MKTRYTSAVSAILFLLSPGMLAQKSVFTFPFENNYRLPSMETRINMKEISNSYQTVGDIFTTEITGIDENLLEQTSMRYIHNAKVTDAIHFLEFYMEEQLVAPGDASSGSLEMSIIYFNERSHINIGTILGVVTFGLGTLFGIPYSTAVIDLEVEASIFNEAGNQGTTHRGVGRGKELQSLYHMTNRKAHQRALADALDDLNSRIMADPEILTVPR